MVIFCFRKKVDHRVSDSRTQEMCIYYDGETVSGAVSITLKPGGRLEHKGIKIELLGQIGKLSGFHMKFILYY